MKNNAVLRVGLEKLDMEAAAQVAQRFVLQEIFLIDAKISREPLAMTTAALSLEHKCSTEFTESPSSEKEKNLFSILCNFQVAAFNGKKPSKLIMKIEASFCTSYVNKPDIHIPDGIDSLRTHAVYLGTINPISNAWPYWREFVQNMSSRMGFPALTVPLLEIALKKSVAKKAKRQPAKKESARRKKVIA